MTKGVAVRELERLRAALKKEGWLLESDASLPSVVGIIAGEKIRGSWWGHPKGNLIYNTAGAFQDEPEVLTLKLISGKRTYVHRDLWPLVLAAVMGDEPWQLAGLARDEKLLLARVRKSGLERLDQLQVKAKSPAGAKALGEAARELEARLLIRTESLHTESGAHAKQLESWPRWLKSRGLKAPKQTASDARAELDVRLAEWNEEHSAKAKLPWSKAKRR